MGVFSSIHFINIEAARLHKAGADSRAGGGGRRRQGGEGERERSATELGKENDFYSFLEVKHGEI